VWIVSKSTMPKWRSPWRISSKSADARRGERSRLFRECRSFSELSLYRMSATTTLLPDLSTRENSSQRESGESDSSVAALTGRRFVRAAHRADDERQRLWIH
jgi:hypothetical protein